MKLHPPLTHKISNDTKITIIAAKESMSNHSAGTEKFQVITTLI